MKDLRGLSPEAEFQVNRDADRGTRNSAPSRSPCLVLTGCRAARFPQYPPNYREYAYVTNGGSDTVTVLDVVDVRVDRELAVGSIPWPWPQAPHATKSTW